MMRRFTMTITAGLMLAGAPAAAQDAIHQVPAPPQPGLEFYAPFVWNDNALDQKILDAQAEMRPLHRPIRQRLHHHRRS